MLSSMVEGTDSTCSRALFLLHVLMEDHRYLLIQARNSLQPKQGRESNNQENWSLKFSVLLTHCRSWPNVSSPILDSSIYQVDIGCTADWIWRNVLRNCIEMPFLKNHVHPVYHLLELNHTELAFLHWHSCGLAVGCAGASTVMCSKSGRGFLLPSRSCRICTQHADSAWWSGICWRSAHNKYEMNFINILLY